MLLANYSASVILHMMSYQASKKTSKLMQTMHCLHLLVMYRDLGLEIRAGVFNLLSEISYDLILELHEPPKETTKLHSQECH